MDDGQRSVCSSEGSSINSWKTASIWSRNDPYNPENQQRSSNVPAAIASPWLQQQDAQLPPGDSAAAKAALWHALGGRPTDVTMPMRVPDPGQLPGRVPDAMLPMRVPEPSPLSVPLPLSMPPLPPHLFAEGSGASSSLAAFVPQPPHLLWCEAEADGHEVVCECLSQSIGTSGGPLQFHFFDANTKFSRWLFEQPRGAVIPFAHLVVGWREAKPCAMALAAARTGDVTLLRPDARRPDLAPLIGHPSQPVHIAVAGMIIYLRKKEQRDRALKWVKVEGAAMAGMNIEVACDLNSLSVILTGGFALSLQQGDAARRNIVSL